MSFTEDFRGKVAPSDQLRRLHAESGLLVQNLREDIIEKNCSTWRSPAIPGLPRVPFLPFPHSLAVTTEYNPFITTSGPRKSDTGPMTAPVMAVGLPSNSLGPISDSGRDSSSNSSERSQRAKLDKDCEIWDASKEARPSASSRSDDRIPILADRLNRNCLVNKHVVKYAQVISICL